MYYLQALSGMKLHKKLLPLNGINMEIMDMILARLGSPGGCYNYISSLLQIKSGVLNLFSDLDQFYDRSFVTLSYVFCIFYFNHTSSHRLGTPELMK